jgi:hypothetical protein
MELPKSTITYMKYDCGERHHKPDKTLIFLDISFSQILTILIKCELQEDVIILINT